jgi:hypothetical protein
MLRRILLLSILLVTGVLLRAQDLRPAIVPNPADQNVALQLHGTMNQSAKIEIFSVLGHKIHELTIPAGNSGFITVNTSQWVPGIYLVRFIYGGNVEVRRLKIQHN